MQSCASAAKLRSGGPILPIGQKAKGLVGNPPPRTGIAYLSRGRHWPGTLSVKNAVRRRKTTAFDNTPWLPNPPQSDQQLACQGHDHGLASTASVLRASSIPLR